MNIFHHNLSAVIAVIVLILAAFVVFSLLSLRIGTLAVGKWATTQNLQVVTARRRSFTPHWKSQSGRGFQFFRVTVRDHTGTDHRAWLRLESDCTEPGIVDVIWDGQNPLIAHSK